MIASRVTKDFGLLVMVGICYLRYQTGESISNPDQLHKLATYNSVSKAFIQITHPYMLLSYFQVVKLRTISVLVLRLVVAIELDHANLSGNMFRSRHYGTVRIG